MSRVTVRRALRELSQAGLIESSLGRGSFVSGPSRGRGSTSSGPLTEPPNALMGFSELGLARRFVPTARVLSLLVRPATLEESEAFGVAPGSDLFTLGRLRMLDGIPAAVDGSRVPLAYAPSLPETDFTTASLYANLDASGAGPVRADYTVQATSADAAQAELLKLQEGAPLLVTRTSAYDSTGRLVEASAPPPTRASATSSARRSSAGRPSRPYRPDVTPVTRTKGFVVIPKSLDLEPEPGEGQDLLHRLELLKRAGRMAGGAALAAPLLGAGTAWARNQGTTLTVWYLSQNPAEIKAVQAYSKKYASANDVGVKVDPYTFDALNKALPLALRSKRGPEVAYASPGTDSTVKYGQNGLLVDLTATARQRGWNKRIPKGLIDYVNAPDKRVWGIPTTSSPSGTSTTSRSSIVSASRLRRPSPATRRCSPSSRAAGSRRSPSAGKSSLSRGCSIS